jgi:hypothetical protein
MRFRSNAGTRARVGPSLRPLAIGLVSCVLGFSHTATTAFAQAPPPGPRYHTIEATRIDMESAPVIDGDLSDPAWAQATVIDELYQDQPNVGEPVSERTVVRILYDDENLYFSFYNYDANPQDIAVRAMTRDGDMYTSDNVRIQLDPGMTRRNGYLFQVSAAGGRRDGLQQNNSDNLFEWNAIWSARVSLRDDGWVAEIAIPFRSVSYEPGQTDWGFDVGRTIRHKNENASWSGYNPALGGADLTMAGTLTGITSATRGLGLDVQVYGTGRLRYVRPGTEGTDLSGTAGGNIYYKITPALTGTLTYNPDFSDSPLDVRQVNTTRFSLFVDETRDFFLQDAAAFEFGGWNFNDNANNARPFFSRRIGLVDGRPVSIIGGGKLSGEYAGFGIGALSVVTVDQGTVPEQVLSVARITHPVFAESRAGIVVTNGDPTGQSNNTILGADFQYRNSNFMGDNIVQADLYYEHSFSDVYGDDDSYGLALNFPDEPLGGRFRFKEVGEEFRPALGFANRRGIRTYDGRFYNTLRYRDSFLRQTLFGVRGELITGLENRRQSWDLALESEFETFTNDRLWIQPHNYFERVPEEFDLPNDVPVYAGDYNWSTVWFRFSSNNGRPISVNVNGECCRFYNGDRYDVSVTLNIRPTPTFDFQPKYEGEFIRLPTGDVDIHILSLQSTMNFTPDMQLSIEAQWDSISRGFAFSGRYLWEYSPGNELFIGFGQTAILPRLRFYDFDAQTSLLTVRLGRTFQF